MIISFSGTGNTAFASDCLQNILGDEIIRLSPGLLHNPFLIDMSTTDRRIIWMLPVHSWAPPKLILQIIKKNKLKFHPDTLHHLVITCGDDIGYADKVWSSAIRKRGWKVGSIFSIQMPNSYVCLPGFDIDPQDVIEKKLKSVPNKINEIADAIKSGKSITKVVRGSFPLTKTYVIQPFFKLTLLSTKYFRVNDRCKGCGKCVQNCPLTTIRLVDGKPHWDKKCTMCLRCYHVCPHHAIEYYKFTKNKGQYIRPGFRIK